jgi:hypothetical protein
MVLFAQQTKVASQLTYSIVFLLCQLSFPLWAQMRKCSPAALFTIALVIYVLFACTDFISMHIERRAAMTAPFFPQDTIMWPDIAIAIWVMRF